MSRGSRSAAGVWRRLFLAVLALALGIAAAAAEVAGESREIYGLSADELGLYMGNSLLSGWRVPEAREVVDRLLAGNAEDPDAIALDAQVLFFEGRYADSLERLRGLGMDGPFVDLVAATEGAARDFHSRKTEHFRVFWDNPKDEVMVEPALAALEAAREAVTAELGFEPQAPVRVEIYPTTAAFTAVSTLTKEEVETSGTIGLCKFDRLMVTSPRATLWGYRWRDTLCHEYVHLALYRLSRGTAPIWVHEGIAKYLEGSWRGSVGELDPASQALLARRMDDGTLISLEAMSPSVAKLPSAEDTTLAFAEVGTMMAFLVQERGADALRRLVAGLGSGEADREALEAVWGGPFATFDEAWRAWVSRLPLERKEVQVIGLQLAEHGKGQEEAPGAIPDPRARDYARLGDLLRARARDRAAASEYAKAYAEEPDAPGIASRHALGLLNLGRFEEAVRVAEAGLNLYPDLAVLWYRKGEGLLSLERPAEATQALEEVLEINPFHAPARTGLLMAARAQGDESGASLQEWALKLLEGHE